MAITIVDNRIILNEADSTAGWTATDGPTLTTAAPDPVESTGCLGMQVSSAVENAYVGITSDDYSAGGSLFVLMADRAEFDTTVNGGIGIQVGDGTNRIAYHVGGSDGTGFRHDVGAVKWASFQIDLANKPANFTAIAGSEASLNEAAITQVGVYFETLAKSVGGADNCFWDIIRFADNGVGIEFYGGTVGTPESWATVATQDRATGNQQAHYLIREVGTGAYDIQGNINIGDATSTNSTYINSNLETFLWADRGQSTNNYYRFNGSGNGTGTTDINFDNCIFNNALSGSMDFSDANITADFRSCTFIGWDVGILNGGSGNDWSNNTFLGCGTIETSGATMSGCTYDNYIGPSGGSILYWNTTTNPNLLIAGSEFTESGGDGEHAIEFPASMTNTTIDIVDCTFNKFNPSNGQPNSTFNVKATSGTLNININGGSGDISYISSGATVNIINNPVTVTITVTDLDGNPIQNAIVFLYSRNKDNFFSSTPVVSVSGSSTTGYVHVTHTGTTVPLDITTDITFIEGTSEPDYNISDKIAAVYSSTEYAYKQKGGAAVTADTATTGSPVHTYVWFKNTTNASGQVSKTRYIANNEGVVGWVRSATTGTRYRQSNISATINATTGLDLTIQMIPDE